MDIGAKLLVALCANKDTVHFTDFRLQDQYFVADEVKLFQFCREFVGQYHVLPTLETIKKKFSDLPAAPDPARYYYDKTLERYSFRKLNRTLTDCNDLMKHQDTWTVANLLHEAANDVRNLRVRPSIVDFNADATALIPDEYMKTKKLGLNMGIQMGWPTLDRMTMGLRPGDVLSMVGRIAMGKTFMVLNIGLHAWKVQKKKVMVVSMEMNNLAIAQRVAAMYTGFSLTDLKAGELTGKQWPQFLHKLKQVQEEQGKMWLVDGNLNATPDDVFNLVYQLEPDVLVVDGAYLLKHTNPRINKFQRVEENLEEIKKRCSIIGIPAVLSYQFNREGIKLQKKTKGMEKPGLEHIAFSDTVGQISSIVLGLFEDENPETMVRRKVSVLKGRGGETGEFYINWDFGGMNFSEISNSDLPQNSELNTGYI